MYLYEGKEECWIQHFFLVMPETIGKVKQKLVAWPFNLSLTDSYFYQQQFHKFDLTNWGPRSIKQQDSYSWTPEDRKQLATLRDAKGLPPIVESPHYNKLPPIKTQYPNQNGPLSESSTADGTKVQNRSHSRSYKSHRPGSISNNYNW